MVDRIRHTKSRVLNTLRLTTRIVHRGQLNRQEVMVAAHTVAVREGRRSMKIVTRVRRR